MANITGEEDYTSNINLALSASAALAAGTAEFSSALNIFLSITAVVGNCNFLVLIALTGKNVSSIHPATNLFFRCLAVTDLCVGLILQAVFTAFLIFGTI